MNDFFRHERGFPTVLYGFKQNDELISAQARQGIDFPHQRFQTVGNGLQYGIAHGVAQAVVDRLETVQVNEQQGHPVSCPVGQTGCMMQPVHQQGTIRQTGQRIVIRDELKMRILIPQYLLRLPPFGDILHGTAHADGLALFIAHHLGTFMHDTNGAVRAHDPVINRVGSVRFKSGFHSIVHHAPVVRMNMLHESLITGSKRSRANPEQMENPIRPEQAILGYLPVPVTHVRNALCVVETFLGFAKLPGGSRNLIIFSDQQQQRRQQDKQQQDAQAI